MTTKKVAFACGMAMVAAGAISPEARAAEGFYAAVHGGLVILQDSSLDDITATGTATGGTTFTATASDLNQEFDRGFAIGGEVGYAFGNGLRVGGEVTYRRNGLGDLSGDLTVATGTTTTATSFETGIDGDISSWAFMLNGYFDINTETPITPYVGVGAGAAFVNVDIDLGTFGEVDDSDTVFAYQGILGVAYAVSENVDIGVEYRYFATTDPEFGGGAELEYRSHNVFVGVTYHM